MNKVACLRYAFQTEHHLAAVRPCSLSRSLTTVSFEPSSFERSRRRLAELQFAVYREAYEQRLVAAYRDDVYPQRVAAFEKRRNEFNRETRRRQEPRKKEWQAYREATAYKRFDFTSYVHEVLPTLQAYDDSEADDRPDDFDGLLHEVEKRKRPLTYGRDTLQRLGMIPPALDPPLPDADQQFQEHDDIDDNDDDAADDAVDQAAPRASRTDSSSSSRFPRKRPSSQPAAEVEAADSVEQRRADSADRYRRGSLDAAMRSPRQPEQRADDDADELDDNDDDEADDDDVDDDDVDDDDQHEAAGGVGSSLSNEERRRLKRDARRRFREVCRRAKAGDEDAIDEMVFGYFGPTEIADVGKVTEEEYEKLRAEDEKEQLGDHTDEQATFIDTTQLIGMAEPGDTLVPSPARLPRSQADLDELNAYEAFLGPEGRYGHTYNFHTVYSQDYVEETRDPDLEEDVVGPDRRPLRELVLTYGRELKRYGIEPRAALIERASHAMAQADEIADYSAHLSYGERPPADMQAHLDKLDQRLVAAMRKSVASREQRAANRSLTPERPMVWLHRVDCTDDSDFNTRRIVLQVRVANLGLSPAADFRLKGIMGPRYDRTQGVIRIVANGQPTRAENRVQAQKMLQRALAEAWKGDPAYVPVEPLPPLQTPDLRPQTLPKDFYVYRFSFPFPQKA
eukprot:TRINITY_DN1255_c0_g3_i1.p1 TRINITY_DN1255_c0_g3~~TRINITY_DN1255_c0_g3_i1.p1  ORF type:complete len:681 (+),score=196.58 TRINITY_DN1255_c0_g3_i1:1296-3338(+)